MGVNNYQAILRIELNNRMCYSGHHLMVSGHFYCWVAGSFNSIIAQKLRTASLRGEPSENAQLTHEHHSGVKYC